MRWFRRLRSRVKSSERASDAIPWLKLGFVYLLFNATLDARYPVETPLVAWFRPTWEASAILFVYGWAASARRRLPSGLHLAIAFGLLLARAFRFMDGFYQDVFHREMRLVMDLPLLPEAVRLLVVTDGTLYTLGQLVLLGVGAWFLFRLLVLALRETERALTKVLAERRRTAPAPQPVLGLAAGVVLLGVGVFPLSTNALDESISARFVREGRFLLEYPELRQRTQAGFENISRLIQKVPHDLALLDERNVTIIIIESYGRGALETDQHAMAMRSQLARFERQLSGRGRAVASSWLLPPSYGGGSWYAHATLSTGIKVWSPLEYDMLLDSQAVPLSRFLSKAGYRTINVMPGTTRAWTQAEFYSFDETIYAQHLTYAGPGIGWGRFPDQFVLDQVRRRYRADKKLTFKEIKLVTSHAPWREVPALVKDWDGIGDGSVFKRLPSESYPMRWSELKRAHWPYVSSIIYDLRVVGDYVERFEAPDALVLVLGDHQAVNEASRSAVWDVPLHVSGPEDLVSRFVHAGFTRGILPGKGQRPEPMEQFLPLFLRTLSNPTK